jgi:hypothetical protein
MDLEDAPVEQPLAKQEADDEPAQDVRPRALCDGLGTRG